MAGVGADVGAGVATVGGGVGASSRVVLALTMLSCGVSQGFGRFTWALLLPAVQRDVLGSYALAGLLGTANVGSYLVGAAVVSSLSGRLEPAHMIRLGMVGSASGLVVLASAPGFAVLLLGMLLTGFGGAFCWIPAPGLAGSVVEPERRGLAIGTVGSGIGSSIVIASLLTNAVHGVAGDDAWRPVWIIEAAVAVVAAGACWRWLRPASTGPAGSSASLGALKQVPGWLGVTLAYAAYGLAYVIFISYVVAALEEDAGFTPSHASNVFTLLGVALTFGGVLSGRVSDRIGRRAALIIAYVAMAACAVVVLSGAEPWAAASALVFGLTMSGIPTVIAAHFGDHLDPRAFAAAFGAVTVFFGLTQLTGPQLGGWLADQTGSFTVSFLLAAAAAALGAVACTTLPKVRKTKGSVLP